jgi:hypothetical protein
MSLYVLSRDVFCCANSNSGISMVVCIFTSRGRMDIIKTLNSRRSDNCRISLLFPLGAATQRGSWPPHSWGFPDHIRLTTVGRTPLDEWSARHRDLYLTTHDTRNRQISISPVGFEPTISVGKRPQTYALDRAATGTGPYIHIQVEYQGCGNCHSCYNIWQSYKFQMFQYVLIFHYNRQILPAALWSWGWLSL